MTCIPTDISLPTPAAQDAQVTSQGFPVGRVPTTPHPHQAHVVFRVPGGSLSPELEPREGWGLFSSAMHPQGAGHRPRAGTL